MPRSEPQELTPRQREILDWIKGFIRKHDIPPTVREIGGAFGIKSSSVFQCLQILERKGHVKRGGLGARSLIMMGQKRHERCAHVEVPVMGRIAAGHPVEAVEDDAGSVTVQQELLRGGGAYALKVVGKSMIGAGILDGDYVVVRKQQTANDGDIVVALIGDEATLKHFHLESGGVRLEPANREMAPIHVTSGEFRIQGKVVGVVRVMGERMSERTLATNRGAP